MSKRRSLVASGCGCFIAIPAGLFLLGGVLNLADGTTPLSGASVCVVIFLTVFAGLGLAAMGWGLRSVPETPEDAMREAARRAQVSGTAMVDLPAGTDAAQARSAFQNAFAVQAGDLDRRWSAATDLMLSGRHEESKQAFEQIAYDAPDRAADAHNSIGACLHMMGRYEEAIATYERARALGADARTVDENIAESREALARRR